MRSNRENVFANSSADSSLVSELIGAYTAYSDPSTFVTRQLPLPPNAARIVPAAPQTAVLLAYTLGSLFMMLGAMNVLCTVVTRDVRTTRYYLALLACGDMGHLYANYLGMGSEVFWGFGAYSDVMMGNVYITLFLLVNRVATLAGVFGRIRRT
jgi:hypothetical protein